jgi:Fe2+ or Zn2+ uptake regulation protein
MVMRSCYQQAGKSADTELLQAAKLLAEEGEIRLRNISGSPERYDHICSNHYHLRCEQCGKVMDVEMPYMASLDEEVRKRNKYLIKSHDLTFVGLCPECAKKKH